MKNKNSQFFILLLLFFKFKEFICNVQDEEVPLKIKHSYSPQDDSEKVKNPLTGMDYWEGPKLHYCDWIVELEKETYLFHLI